MKCSNCGHELPNDSTFCQYCGQKLPTNVSTCNATIANSEPLKSTTTTVSQEKKKVKVVYCRKCGNIIDNTTKKCTRCGKQYANIKHLVPIIILLIVTIFLAGLNVYQYSINVENARHIRGLNNTIASQKATISSQTEKLRDLMDSQNTDDRRFDSLDEYKEYLREKYGN